MDRWKCLSRGAPCWNGLTCMALVALFANCKREGVVVSTPIRTGDSIVADDPISTDEWTMAMQPRELQFPRDHLAHPDYRIEWWYYTGNLATRDGRRFGYQLTFFRTGLQREPTNPSRWAVRDLYTAHFAISDVANKNFLRFERTHRGGVDWAGTDEKGRVWNGDWELVFDSDTDHQSLRAARDGHSIELTLKPRKPTVFHGDRGLSRKGASAGNASYYYSFTRLETQGKLSIDGASFDVQGESWMDHEFSSSFLERGQQGWDWFSIQLDSGEELMLYQMRLRDGTADPHSSGTWILKDGSTQSLARDDFSLEPLGRWRSKSTGARYPTAWRVRVPSLELDLDVTALMPNQEMDTSASTGIIYWEGCVDIKGKHSGRDTAGKGYLEMTGYTGRGLGEILN